MIILISLFVSMVAFAVLDFIWLGYVMKDFNLKQLADIGRIVDGDFQILYGPAVLTYILMAIGVTFFVLPQTQGLSLGSTFLKGALLGLVVYGVFDMTNLAILKNYPLTFTFADMAWGTFVFGAVSVITQFIVALQQKPSL